MSAATGGVAQAIAGELQLMRPEVRASRVLADRLLDPDFTEVGASGRQWDRQSMLAELPALSGASPDGPGPEPAGLSGVELAPGVVHVTYETTFGGRRALRSSIWRKLDESSGWRMYYHQATPVPDDRASG